MQKTNEVEEEGEAETEEEEEEGMKSFLSCTLRALCAAGLFFFSTVFFFIIILFSLIPFCFAMK